VASHTIPMCGFPQKMTFVTIVRHMKEKEKITGGSASYSDKTAKKPDKFIFLMNLFYI
jgi:hypothetical protein